MNVTDESTQRKTALHNNTGGLSYFYPGASCLSGMGFTAAQGHVALSGVHEDRHGDSAVEEFMN